MKILNMVIPVLMYFTVFFTELESCKPHKAARHPTIYDVVNEIKLFPTVYIAGYTVANV